MVAKSESNDVFQAAHTGALDAAKELGDKDGVDIEIDWRTPPTDDAAKQADAISSLTNEKVDGITVSCSEARMLNSAINDAVDKGVPVVCFDSDAPDSKRICDYGTDDTQLGHLLMSRTLPGSWAIKEPSRSWPAGRRPPTFSFASKPCGRNWPSIQTCTS